MVPVTRKSNQKWQLSHLLCAVKNGHRLCQTPCVLSLRTSECRYQLAHLKAVGFVPCTFFFFFFNFYFEICWTRTGKFPKWRTSGSPNAVEQLLLGRETPFSSGYVKLCKSMKRFLKLGFQTFGLKLIFNAFLTCSTSLY